MWEDFLNIGCWVAFIVVYLVFIKTYGNKGKSQKDHSHRSFYGGLYVTGIISIILYITGFTRIELLFPYQKIVGVVLAFLGLSFTIVARLRLRNRWSVNARVSDNFIIEKRFPYNIVRHPIYSGQALICLGTAFVTSNIGIFIVLFIGTAAHNYYRAFKEESLINEITNGEYERVFSRVGRLFPRILSFLYPKRC